MTGVFKMYYSFGQIRGYELEIYSELFGARN